MREFRRRSDFPVRLRLLTWRLLLLLSTPLQLLFLAVSMTAYVIFCCHLDGLRCLTPFPILATQSFAVLSTKAPIFTLSLAFLSTGATFSRHPLQWNRHLSQSYLLELPPRVNSTGAAKDWCMVHGVFVA